MTVHKTRKVEQHQGDQGQEQEEEAEEEVKKPVKQVFVEAEKPKQKTRKFTFKENQEYQSLAQTIETLENQKKALEEKLLQGGDYKQLHEWSTEIEKLKFELERKTDRWLYQ